VNEEQALPLLYWDRDGDTIRLRPLVEHEREIHSSGLVGGRDTNGGTLAARHRAGGERTPQDLIAATVLKSYLLKIPREG
jgi:hypothetical protein